MNINGARVIITGAAGGLGRKTAELLAAKGAKVVGIDVLEASSSRSDITHFRCDLTDRQATSDTIRKAIDTLGGVDILINNAGTLALQDAAREPTSAAHRSFDVNFWAAWHVTAAAMPHLVKSSGKVINIASLFAYVNAPLVPSYNASKRAVSAFSDSLRMQYAGKIGVTTLYPGFIDTDIHKDAVRQGLSVAKIIDIRPLGLRLLKLEEPVESAARGVIRACRKNIREAGTTRMGTLSLWFARHMPAFVDAFLRVRIGYLVKHGALQIKLDDPLSQ
ncbi:MAG: SDR family NAD(P)-dependent oxidoreductase [Pseudomonadota bacterium]